MTEQHITEELNKAKEALSEKRFDDAIEQLEKLNEYSPDNPEVLSALGVAHAENKDYHPALSYFRKAASIAPTARAHFNIAMVHNILNEKEKTLIALREALAIDPNYERAKKLLAQLNQSITASAIYTQPTTPQAPPAPQPATAATQQPTAVHTPAGPSGQPQHAPQPVPADSHPGQQAPHAPGNVTPTNHYNYERNWTKITGAAVLIGIPFLLLWMGWFYAIAPLTGWILSLLISLALVSAITWWLAQSAGAYEITHWIVMLLLTGLLPSLLMIKGFDIMASGWYEPVKRN